VYRRASINRFACLTASSFTVYAATPAFSPNRMPLMCEAPHRQACTHTLDQSRRLFELL
jgi:hypothetical protein